MFGSKKMLRKGRKMIKKYEENAKGMIGKVSKNSLIKQFSIVFRNKILFGNSNVENSFLSLFSVKY